jgi:hypothetical protein
MIAKRIPERVAGLSFLQSAGTQQEDKWQGKIGLVIALGHDAFKSKDSYNFGPDTVKVGDWVWDQYGDRTDQGPDHNVLDMVPLKTSRTASRPGFNALPRFRRSSCSGPRPPQKICDPFW